MLYNLHPFESQFVFACLWAECKSVIYVRCEAAELPEKPEFMVIFFSLNPICISASGKTFRNGFSGGAVIFKKQKQRIDETKC